MSKQSIRLPYLSDLSNKEWELIKPHIPTLRSNRGRKHVHSYREILNAIFYLELIRKVVTYYNFYNIQYSKPELVL